MKQLKLAVSLLLAVALCAALAACGMRAATNPEMTERATYPGNEPPNDFPEDFTDIPDDIPDGTTGGLPSESFTENNTTVPAAAAPQAVAPSAVISMGAKDPTAQTHTGLRPLDTRAIAIADPNNSGNLPVKMIAHSFGVAKDNVVHKISRDAQAFFDAKHYPAVVYDTVTPEKVIYLTFDCGYENGETSKILDVLKEKKVPAAFFCTMDEMKSAPDVVARMINEGHIVGNHSVTHPSFAAIDRSAMAREVLEADNFLRKNFGYSAPFFRFPKGEYTESALEAVGSLGYTSIFWSVAYSDWDPSQQKGAQYALDTVTTRLHPGCILLLHSVSSDNAQAMAQIIDNVRAQGYTFQDLTKLPIFHA
jgi:peptidoglycan-N-acetylmuramic acid deacetylase